MVPVACASWYVNIMFRINTYFFTWPENEKWVSSLCVPRNRGIFRDIGEPSGRVRRSHQNSKSCLLESTVICC
jgi:hypothetical protein